MPESHEIRLKRLRFQSWHRGCKETDVILGQFSDELLHTLSPAQLDSFEALLEEADADIWNWLVDKTSPPDNRYDEILAMLKQIKVHAVS